MEWLYFTVQGSTDDGSRLKIIFIDSASEPYKSDPNEDVMIPKQSTTALPDRLTQGYAA